ncbi:MULTISPECIES: fimbrial biogenesis chaperone [unclassified Sphingomonas]|uniref:fimbrial biogenesis chaperone n=1 Tax=unclassified Sphingomonas TaxID=196159 RepID=UPI0022B3A177|nr:fimbria/pilus periplasmic chaperone [Sphingomonas sp. NIBR02145]WHU03532.1 fimbria/pilus periplasmic chaperone [Sphingomonas sp. NIBR02145]
MKKWVRGLALGPALAAAMLASTPLVQAETVQPVVVDLTPTGSGMSQTITVENTFTQPLPVELRVEELTFDQAGLHGTGKDSGDLLIFPPQAIIQPGQTQSFRVQYIGDPALARSKHYYVTVAQLPVQLPQGQSAIQILYNFQVLVSVRPAGARPELKIAKSEVALDEKGQAIAAITLTNDSPAHGYLSKGRLRIVERDRSGKEVFRRTLAGPEIQQTVGFGLVGAGQTRRLLIPIQLPTSEGTIDAQFTPEG